MKFKGVVLVADKPTVTGRIYSKKVLESIVRQVQEKIAAGACYGRVGCPGTFSLTIDKISHRITDIKLQENELICGGATLKTPLGRQAQAIIESGDYTLVPDGFGTLHDDKIVGEDYQLISINIMEK